MMVQNFNDYIKSYPDFPKKGIIFRDISPLLADAKAFSTAIDAMATIAKNFPDFDKIVAIDARGFIFGGALADRLHKGMVPCRKPNKLPGELITETYEYEYSSNSLSIQSGAIEHGERVLIVDDVLASGNTLLSAYKLVNKLGGEVVGVMCFLELSYLNGRQLLEKNIEGIPLQTVLRLQK